MLIINRKLKSYIDLNEIQKEIDDLEIKELDLRAEENTKKEIIEREEKIKKQAGQTEMTLALRTTPDIARALGESKRTDQMLVGFALETEHEKENALHKMERKHLNAIILNSLREQGAGFGTDTNKVTILQADGKTAELPLLSKADVAAQIVDTLFT